MIRILTDVAEIYTKTGLVFGFSKNQSLVAVNNLKANQNSFWILSENYFMSIKLVLFSKEIILLANKCMYVLISLSHFQYT